MKLKDMIAELQKSGRFKTTNDQLFYAAPYDRPWNTCGYMAFKVGTVDGIWHMDKKAYYILAVVNDQPNNGHFEDLLDWFYVSACRAGLPLIFQEVDNLKDVMPSISGELSKHLVEKRGFKKIDGTDDYIKDLASIEKEVKKKLDDKTYIK